MKKRVFTSGVEATAADFNGVGDVAEEGLGDLVAAVTPNNDASGVIFSDAPPTNGAGPPWTITLPEQRFAIDGVIGILNATTFAIAAGARTVAVFLRIQRTTYSENRNFLDLSGADPATGNASYVVERRWVADYIVVDPYTGSGDNPAAAADDVGDPIKLATFTVTTGPNAIAINEDPDNRVWTLPAGAPATHGSAHLTGGADPIPVATPLTSGLMSAALYNLLASAVTSIAVAAGSEFLVVTTTAGPPKTVSVSLRLVAQSLKKVSVLGVDYLALNFVTGGLAGESDRPARADHRHAMTDSPVQIIERTILVPSASILGTLVSVELPIWLSTVARVEAFWVPPGATTYPRIFAPWGVVPVGGVNRRVGCRYTMAGVRSLRVRIGDDALCEMTPEELAIAVAAVGSQTWDSVGGSGGLLPRTGRIILVITGVRA